MMKVVTAEHAGFCFGVQRAVEEAEKCAEHAGTKVFTYGPLIHNESVIRDLEEKGIFAVETDILESQPDNIKITDDTLLSSKKENNEIADTFPQKHPAPILIRAHGVGRETERRLRERYETVIDATCPFVKKIHRIVAEHSAAREQIIIIGSATHPEVVGIRGWAQGDCITISNEKEAKELDLDASRKVCIVAQTTFHFNKFQDLVEIIKQKVYDVVAFNTICNATEERQREAERLAGEVDAMLVLGGENSSNSKKLFEICRAACPHTYFLQTSDDLDRSTLLSFDSIGITAGASTPHYIIEEVQKKCQK